MITTDSNLVAILEQISQSSTQLSDNLPPKRTYALIVKEAIKLVGADHGSLVLKQDDDLVRVYSTYRALYEIRPIKRGLPYRAFSSNTPLLVQSQDVGKINPKFESLGIKSIIFIPLFSKNKPIGALNVYYFKKKFFTNDQLKVLELFGSMASLAILKNRLNLKVKEVLRNEKAFKNIGNVLQRVNKAGLKFLSQLNLEETYATIVSEAVKLIRAEYGSLALKQGNELKRVYTTLPIADKVKFRREGFTNRAFREHRSFVIYKDEIQKIHPEMRKIGIKSNIFIPLTNQGKTVGVLIINSLKENHLSDGELSAVRLLGSMASLAIRKAQLYDDTKRALESRDLFISMAAHELRTPTTTINGYAQLLKQKLQVKNLPEVSWAEELSWEGIRLSLLINELLDVSRIKGGKMQFNWKECSLNEIVARAVQSFKFVHPERTLVVDNKIADGEDKIIADFDKILQVLINILDNAAKFSSSESSVILSIKFKKPYFTISIKDHGKGIASEDLGRIFEGFYRARGEQREGMGLGLFLAKNIVEAHRGDIQVRSKLNKGTRVELTIKRVAM